MDNQKTSYNAERRTNIQSHKQSRKEEMSVEHNQCERCLKKFRTALGFHRHYHWCLENSDLKIV